MLLTRKQKAVRKRRVVNAFIFFFPAKISLKTWKTNLSTYETTFIT